MEPLWTENRSQCVDQAACMKEYIQVEVVLSCTNVLRYGRFLLYGAGERLVE
jgi:hypothetical protein